MDNQLNQIPKILLMGPGPSCVSISVYEALAKPTLGHLDPAFITLMDEIKEYLKQLMGTENELTVPISGTGSAGMETCFVNLVEPRNKVLILINGVFGTRMEDVATRLGAEVDSLNSLGAQKVADFNEHSWTWTVLSDLEGNEFCVEQPIDPLMA